MISFIKFFDHEILRFGFTNEFSLLEKLYFSNFLRTSMQGGRREGEGRLIVELELVEGIKD